MIIISVCNSCLQCLRLNLTPADKDLLTQIEVAPGMCKCPREGCTGIINLMPVTEFTHLEGKVALTDNVIELTAKELYAALYGNGLPDEIQRDPTVVEALLKANRVIEAQVEKTSSGSVYLHTITLENGLIIHLGGGMGPRVVKITNPETTLCYCKQKRIRKGHTYYPCSRATEKSTSPRPKESHAEGGCDGVATAG